MIKDITLGQFFPGTSLLHKLDARIKILITVLYIVTVFLAGSLSAFILLAAFTAVVIFISQIKLKVIIKAIRPLLFILAFTMIINILFFAPKGDDITPILQWWKISIYAEGIYRALFMMARISLLLLGTSVFLTYTTSPIALTDGIERLLSPLKKIKIPVHEFAMMMSLALRFIPTLIEETDKIMSAQKARGASLAEGNLLKRAKSLIPILIPLFISAFRRADELATAMECRCYRGGAGRTRMTILKCKYFDYLSLAFLVLLGAGIVCLNIFYPIYTIPA